MNSPNSNGLIGMVLVSHCQLAAEMMRVAELIVGPLPQCLAVCFAPDEPVDDMVRRLDESIRQVDGGWGVLVLTDLFGGTPANISLSFAGEDVEVVCGMNLPMLIKFTTCRTAASLREAAKTLKEYGQRHIALASEIMARSVPSE